MLLEDSEIDEWFQQEKEKLAGRLFSELERGLSEEKARAHFDEGFSKLFRAYNKKYRTAVVMRARHERLERPFKRFLVWRAVKRSEIKRWWKVKKEQYKKWRFERQYQHLFQK